MLFRLDKPNSGSSPLTWRILHHTHLFRRMIGIISTYVENTYQIYHLALLDRDHLHLRGEYPVFADNRIVGTGSSPLTWRILELHTQYLA